MKHFISYSKFKTWSRDLTNPWTCPSGSNQRSRVQSCDLRNPAYLSVRNAVSLNCSLLFWNFAIRARKCLKNFPSTFSKKFPFCPYWPKTVQNWPFFPKIEFFCIFFPICSSEFVNVILSLLFGIRKNDVFAFFEKIKKLPFSAKFG